MAKKIQIPKGNIGYGYVGVWWSEDPPGELGWMAPQFISGPASRRSPDTASSEDLRKYAKGERLFLCKITCTPIKDKKGRPITKIVKK